jgi:4-hydroxythreonine-4-phosphate dehydrogenase
VTEKPIVAITLGDPCGIGPEVVAKALEAPAVHEACRPVVIGSTAVLDRALVLTHSKLHTKQVASPSERMAAQQVAVLDPGSSPVLSDLTPGTLSAEAGKASVKWVLEAGRLALDHQVSAMATAPINKAAASLAGYQEIGHMELLQHMADVPSVLTMLMTTDLRVVHLSTHRALRLACDYVTMENVLGALRMTDAFFAEHGMPAARIGVAALNPHGGEEGLLGSEEQQAIGPAVEAAVAEGINAIGPVPADSVFLQTIEGRYDVALAMYHDQGHIPVKVHNWEASTTVNLGLPFIRTSVDHGTAFDIAGSGKADPTSMVTAIRWAAHLVAGHPLNSL